MAGLMCFVHSAIGIRWLCESKAHPVIEYLLVFVTTGLLWLSVRLIVTAIVRWRNR